MSRTRPWIPAAALLLGVGWGANQFTPMLLVYETKLGAGTATLEAIFGLYALGLIPGLLIAGPLSDRWGRRRLVAPVAVLSLAASLILMLGGEGTAPLFAGRLAAGLASGAAFSIGTAWLKELSVAPFGTVAPADAARRAAISMTAGFGLGPLVAGALAQWAPAPTVLPYVPHIAIMGLVLVALPLAPETVEPARDARTIGAQLRVSSARQARFLRVVVPMAPWVFAAPAIAFALLPGILDAEDAHDGIAFTAAITAATALAGVLAQPLARRLTHTGAVGLATVGAGLLLGAWTAQAGDLWLLVPSAIVLGAAYGLCFVAGLVEVQRMASANELAGLTAVYYAVTYLGFAAPYGLAAASALASYTVLLSGCAALAFATGALVVHQSRHQSPASARPTEPSPPAYASRARP